MSLFWVSCFLILISVFVGALGLVGIYYCLASGFFINPPPVPSDKKVRDAVLKEIETTLSCSSNKIIMDLGSGWGSFLIPLAKQFPAHSFIGIEKAFLPYFYAKIKGRRFKNLRFERQNFFLSDISKADIVILYLIAHIMPRVTQKCLSEMKNGAVIYSNHFPLTNIQPVRIQTCGHSFDRYYVYEINHHQKALLIKNE